MDLIDTHAHSYSEEFDGDRAASIQRAMASGINKILLPAIDSSSHAGMFELEGKFPEVCRAMMGLHPCYVKDNWQQEMSVIQSQLERRKFVAIGEIGLDFYWDLSFKEQQYAAFRQQIELALQYQLPIAIHSRNATDECIAVVKEAKGRGLRGVFHCFSGSVAQAMEVIGLGFYLGIGGVLTFKNSGLDKVVMNTGLDRVVLETDAPYLAPVPYRGKRNEPAYTMLVAEKLAAVLNLSIEEVAMRTTANAEDLFGL